MSRLIVYLCIVSGIIGVAALAGHTWTERKWAARWAKAVAAQQVALAAEQAKNRSIEKHWNDVLRDAEVQHAKDLQTVRDAKRSADLVAQRLQNSLATVNSRTLSDDSLDACRERAATLGQLFAEADQEAGELADEAERVAAELRKMIAGYPVNATASP